MEHTQKVSMKMDSRKQIALERIRILFQLAKEVVRKDPGLAQRYVEVARRIAMATKVRLPKEYRRLVCKHCKSFILPGVSCRVRTQTKREPHLVITCFTCGKHSRMLLRRRTR